MKEFLKPVSHLLIALGVLSGWQPLPAQEAPPPENLKIKIVRGEGFINKLDKKGVAREAIVEVRDRNNKPVSGATVTFLLPGSGPGGAFANGQRALTAFTGPNGRVVASGFTPNNISGTFQINVTATSQGQTATAAISQTNAAAGAAGGGLGTAATVGIVGAAAAVATVVGVVVAGGGRKGRVSVGGPTLP